MICGEMGRPEGQWITITIMSKWQTQCRAITILPAPLNLVVDGTARALTLFR
jgi:hypothetical protein